jgi:hypothetical protein
MKRSDQQSGDHKLGDYCISTAHPQTIAPCSQDVSALVTGSYEIARKVGRYAPSAQAVLYAVISGRFKLTFCRKNLKRRSLADSVSCQTVPVGAESEPISGEVEGQGCGWH